MEVSMKNMQLLRNPVVSNINENKNSIKVYNDLKNMYRNLLLK